MTGNKQRFNPLLEDDLKSIWETLADIKDEIKGKTFFITGGTGFFGKWFLETFAYANHKLDLNCKVIVLSRNPEKYLNEFVYIKNNSIFKFIKGDVRDFVFPRESIDYIIHAATEASAKLNNEDPLLMMDTIIEGTKRTLELAKEKKVKSFLFISSGAVYGKQPPEITHVPEDYLGAPNCQDPNSAYGEGKRVGELLCAIYFKQFGVPVKIARCFAFVGPYLPLDTHFAIGNFINDGIKGVSIIIKGDGTPYRSYLYAADLVIWLLTILLKGNNNLPYNVGSDYSIPIKTVANIVAKEFDPPRVVEILHKDIVTNTSVSRYVPSIKIAANELDLKSNIKIEDAVKRTINFYLKQTNKTEV